MNGVAGLPADVRRITRAAIQVAPARVTILRDEAARIFDVGRSKTEPSRSGRVGLGTVPSPTESSAPASTAGAPMASQASSRKRRLIADRRYFGLEARILRSGLARAWARVSTQRPGEARLDVASLVEDFRVEPDSGPALAELLVAGGLLESQLSDGYRPTPLFREYSQAVVVAPLSRARAKVLIERARNVAAHINGDGSRNPFLVRMIAVSGSYMSRQAQLPELCLWVVLRKRPNASRRRWRRTLGKGDALRQILGALNALSSFIVVRIVTDKRMVQRPFAVVFESGERFVVEPVHAWERFRDWGASISQRLVAPVKLAKRDAPPARRG